MKRLVSIAAMLAVAGYADSKKLTPEERVDMIRGMTAEFATVKVGLPIAKKPLPVQANGSFEKEKWEELGREMGPAARVGDLVQVTRVFLENDRMMLEINGGVHTRGKWYDHVQVGMGGSGQTTPVNRNPGSGQPLGTSLVLLFSKDSPPTTPAEIKKMLAPVLDFEKHTATENFVEKLPPEVQKAIKEKKAIEGMDQEQVLLALGKPRRKTRETKEGVDLEDWIYGDPPGKITFVTFAGSKVAKVKDAYAGIGGSTAADLPVR